MKKHLFILSALISFVQFLWAQENSSGNATEKFKLGIGVSTYNLEGAGGSIKADYLFSDKVSLGLLGAFSLHNFNDVEFENSTIDYHSGRVTSLLLTTSYHFIGDNRAESNLGVYTSLGLGYLGNKYFSDFNSKLLSNNINFQEYKEEFSWRNLSASLNLGAEYKLGKGKIYAELPLLFDVYGTYSNKYLSQKNNLAVNNPDYKYDGFRDFNFSFFMNLGYQFYF